MRSIYASLLCAAATLWMGCAEDAQPDAPAAPALDQGIADAEIDAADAADQSVVEPPSVKVSWPKPGFVSPGGRLLPALEVTGADLVRLTLDDGPWRAWSPHDHVAPLPPGARLLRIEARAGVALTTQEIPFIVGPRLSAGASHTQTLRGTLGAQLVGSPQAPLLALAARSAGQGGLDAQGDAWLWGALPIPDSAAPLKLAGPWIQLVHGGDAVWLVHTSGELWAAGRNDRGQLGLGRAGERVAALERSPLVTDVVMVAAGTSHALALRADGLVWAMGDNRVGQMGLGDVGDAPQLEPILIPTLSDVAQIACGREHSLALLRDGSVMAWGNGTIGQLGHGSSGMLASRAQPVAVVGLPPIVAIAAGNLQSYAIDHDGVLWAWGQNSLGQLGVGNTTNKPTARAVAIPSPVEEVAVGQSHGVARTRSGELWLWGSNDSGQLGVAEPARSSTPLKLEE